jgi:hypothetical protein
VTLDFVILVKLQDMGKRQLVLSLFFCIGLSLIIAPPAKAGIFAVSTGTVIPATLTASPTTQTVVPTISSPTIGPSPTRTASPTTGPSPTATSTPTLTPTTTLIPLPEITLIFPVPTKTPTVTKTVYSPELSATATPSGQNNQSQLSPRFILLAGLIMILWLFLAIFAIIYIRQIR